MSLWWWLVACAVADPSMFDRMEGLDAAIEAAPCNLDLRSRRALLLVRAGWLDAAEVDLDDADTCGSDPRLDGVRAELALAIGEPAKVLSLPGNSAMNLRLRARALSALGRGAEALEQEVEALAFESHPTPEALLHAGRALLAVGEPTRVLNLLAAHRTRIGPVRSLSVLAAEASLAAGEPSRGLPWVRGDDAELAVLRAQLLKQLDDPRWRATHDAAAAALESWRPSAERSRLLSILKEML